MSNKIKLFINNVFKVVSFLLFTVNVASAQTYQVGWIQEIKNVDENAYLIRGGKKITPALLMPVFNEDVIHVDKKGSVDIQINKNLVKIQKNNSPYKVSHTVEQATVHSRLLGWASTFFDDDDGETMLSTVSAVSRSVDAIDVPIFGFSTQKILQRKELAFIWRNGKAPFHVMIQSQDTAEVLITRDNITSNEIKLNISNLKVGRYKFILSDSQVEKEFLFDLVLPDEAPLISRNILCMNKVQCELFLVLELLQKGQDEWLMESYQVVSQYADGNFMAYKIREQLK
ncbi:MAG: hypothetical protein DIZ80_08140 [endosymbiont of Galathealinum brachiosum]|uniref:Uncharacterized protein n=1 Tax=endosymbiont of Galathealinum brachiosum TaxID=2200906 RepID=A0A370DGS1_9GAMM|nr:MAG: hypothetical protein DIZ80_08140 [endosymbiont of Galathealinum brachiosum]